jgi:hypothetical protein
MDRTVNCLRRVVYSQKERPISLELRFNVNDPTPPGVILAAHQPRTAFRSNDLFDLKSIVLMGSKIFSQIEPHACDGADLLRAGVNVRL